MHPDNGNEPSLDVLLNLSSTPCAFRETKQSAFGYFQILQIFKNRWSPDNTQYQFASQVLTTAWLHSKFLCRLASVLSLGLREICLQSTLLLLSPYWDCKHKDFQKMPRQRATGRTIVLIVYIMYRATHEHALGESTFSYCRQACQLGKRFSSRVLATLGLEVRNMGLITFLVGQACLPAGEISENRSAI